MIFCKSAHPKNSADLHP